MNKAIIYVRCSTDMQDTTHQIKACKTYAQNHNLGVDKIIKDENISAYSTNYTERPGLMEVLELASKGVTNNLIIFSTDRLSRDHLQGQIIINNLSQYNVIIHSVNEGIVNKNEIDSLLNSIRFFQSQLESKKTSERVKSAKRLASESRKWAGNMLPFGYAVDENKRIIVNEKERPIVIDFFNHYLNYGNADTIRYMKEKYNIKLTKCIWLVKNRTFIGYPYKAHPDLYFKELQIVPTDLWNSVQAKIKERAVKPQHSVVTNRTGYLLEGIIYHACGNKMYISTDKKIYTFYKCNKCFGSSYKKSFVQSRIDDAVDKMVSEWFNQLDKGKLLEKFNANRNVNNSKLSFKLNQLSNLLSTKKQTLNNANKKLSEAFSKDYPLDMIKVLTDSINTLKTSINALEGETAELQEQLEVEKGIIDKELKLTDELLNFKYLYFKATYKEKKLLIRSIVEKVIVTDYDNIKIIYKY